ncbi:hypothetical protein ABNQ38_31265 [Azospirillum sp. A29]|jgi:hypothetical protein|uniref:hypothetical protein n=1 Tax=Azospirillum sp. A29 TaxID=3160606 RepID=UPI00366BC5CE
MSRGKAIEAALVDWLSPSTLFQADLDLRIFCIRFLSKFDRFLPVMVFTGIGRLVAEGC